jgi:hypothetical protein
MPLLFVHHLCRSFLWFVIPIVDNNQKDELMWMHSKDGNYSVKTGYNAIQNWINNDHPGSSNQDFMNSV